MKTVINNEHRFIFNIDLTSQKESTSVSLKQTTKISISLAIKGNRNSDVFKIQN